MGGALLLVACVPSEMPGTDQGSHHFTGVLLENSCGPSAVPAESIIEMNVQLRRDGALGLWRRPGAPLIYGSAQDDGGYRFQLGSTVGVYEYDPVTNTGPCSLDQYETITIEVVESDDEEEGIRYEGTSEVRFAPSSGSDCSPSLAAFGGPFLQMPCGVEYELQSEAIDTIFPGEEEPETQETSE